MVGRRTDIVRRTDRLYGAPGLGLSQYPDLLLLFEQNSSYVTSTFLGSRQQRRQGTAAAFNFLKLLGDGRHVVDLRIDRKLNDL